MIKTLRSMLVASSIGGAALWLPVMIFGFGLAHDRPAEFISLNPWLFLAFFGMVTVAIGDWLFDVATALIIDLTTEAQSDRFFGELIKLLRADDSWVLNNETGWRRVRLTAYYKTALGFIYVVWVIFGGPRR